MSTLFRAVVMVCLVVAANLVADDAFDPQGKLGIEQMKIALPKGWRLHQDTRSDGAILLGFAKGDAYVNFYARRESNLNMNAVFVNGARVLRDIRLESRGAFTWKVMETLRKMPTRYGESENHYVTAFLTELSGVSYYGYTAADSQAAADKVAFDFMDRFELKTERNNFGRSLTAPDYTGKKYYLGWGAAMNNDPNEMKNEVKYDVIHTNDIFTKDIGGNYIGSTLIQTLKRADILKQWNDIKAKMTAKDMFVQYSSGHGSRQGLAVGVNYNEIRDNALGYPAKEIIIFTMSCYSGNLVSAFNKKKSTWEKWGDDGRTLMVMASSGANQESSTGPGTDPDQAGGPNGSAGSAFGYSLWKALIGYADGFVDGVKDGFISLGEIEKYTEWKTKQVGHHTPVVTGVYKANLIMNKVPPKAWLDSLEGGSEGLTDQQILAKIDALDQELRVP